MKKIILLCVSIAFIFTQGFAVGAIEQITPEKSKEIIGKIRSISIPRYKEYSGVESKRNVEVKEYDSSNKLLVTHKYVVDRKDFFYILPESKVLKYEKDGKEKKPTEYKELKSEPTYPVFDEKGEQYYETSVVSVQILDGNRCYKIKVTPKQSTDRHFSGYLYYKTDDFEPYLAEGTIGKLPWSLEEFYMRFYFTKETGCPMFKSGVMNMKVNVPVLIPSHKFDTTISVFESKMIPN
jgi:hypothetical protein